MRKRALLILAGPSAVGKTTVMGELLTGAGGFSFVRSLTTRPPRFPGDTEYLYVTKTAFDEAKRAGRLLEYTEYADFAYATPVSEIERIGKEGKTPLLILDLAGARSLKTGEYGDSVFTVYLFDRLSVTEKRLREREYGKGGDPAEAEKTVKKRTGANVRDYGALADYESVIDAFVKNDKTPKETAGEVLSLFSLFLEKKEAQPAAEKDRVIALLKEESERSLREM